MSCLHPIRTCFSLACTRLDATGGTPYRSLCTSQFQNRPSPPPPGQTPGPLTFLKNFGQIPRYVASLDGQMPHPLELQRGSNPPPSRHVKATVLNFFSCVKPFIQMYIFCNKQLATVWIKICVNCNFNDNRVIC